MALHMTYLDFDIEVTGVAPDYTVSVRSPAGEVREAARFPLSQLELENRLQALKIALLQSGSVRRVALPPEQQAVQSLGRELFDFLFPPEARALYRSGLRTAREQDAGLRIRLRTALPELAVLPWEYLYDPAEGEYISLSAASPIVRYLEVPQAVVPLTVTPPLRILAMIAAPRDLPELNVQVERQRLDAALGHLVREGLVELHWLEGETQADLRRILRRERWHIFHFVGHGDFDPRTDEGLLLLCDGEGRSAPLPATQLARLLVNHGSLRLAVLSACRQATGGTRDIFSSTSAILMRRGLPGVVAMQEEITDRAAIEFMAEFYRALADGLPVDAAVTDAPGDRNPTVGFRVISPGP